jgi:hypothetical protein
MSGMVDRFPYSNTEIDPLSVIQDRHEHQGRCAVSSASTSAAREEQVIERITAMRKRRPRLIDAVVTLAHGAGGKSSAALVDSVFLEAFRNPALEQLGDGALLTLPSGERLALSTDSFAVSPLRFPGGSIGHLAVHGTVNDLAPTWRPRRGRPGSCSSPATPRWCRGARPMASTSRPRPSG